MPRQEEHQNTEARLLSGGEQKMMARGRMLISDAALIIIAGPAKRLTSKVMALAAGSLRDLKCSGMAVLPVAQKLTIALEMTDRSLVLRRGQVVFQHPPAEPLANSETRKEWLAF